MDQDPFIGRILGAYRIVEKIGEGGMGAVYRATHQRLGREAAIKVLPRQLLDDHPQFAQRFFVEARTAAQINHPNIVQVHDAGEQEGLHFIAMEFVKGVSLKQRLETRGALDEREGLKIVLQAARGLADAAKRNVIHRDIKPANLMINDKGAVKIADFGLAKDLESDVSVTQSGQILGTPAYMSPEQGEAETVDFRTDIYSLGVTFFEILTGAQPFQGDTPVAVLMKHCTSPVPDPRTLRTELSEPIAGIIMKMMAKKPADRYASYDELLAALRKAAKALRAASAPPPERPPTPPPRKPARTPDKTPPTLSKKKVKKRHPRSGRRTESGVRTPAPAASRTPLYIGAGAAALVVVVLIAVLAFRDTSPGGAPSPETDPAPEAGNEPPEEKKPGETLSMMEAYDRAWEAAEQARRKADRFDDAGTWDAVVEAASRARDIGDTLEARALETLATARRDFALARNAEADGKLDEALELAEKALESEADVPGLATYAKALAARLDALRVQKAREKRIADLTKRAREHEAKGSLPDLEKAVSLWADVLAATVNEEDRRVIGERIDALSRRIEYAQAMARGREAEAAGHPGEAAKAYREALSVRPGDEKAARALERIEEAAAPGPETEPQPEPPPDTPEARKARYNELVLAAADRARQNDEDASLDALRMLREALEFADDPTDRRLVERTIARRIIEVLQDAMARGREAMKRNDWITAVWAFERALVARPGEPYPTRLLEKAKREREAVESRLGPRFLLPRRSVQKDARGRPIVSRQGSRMHAGLNLPHEIWLDRPRMELVLVPPGRFDLGSPASEEGRYLEEGPLTRVTLERPFYIGKYECTQGQWETIVGTNPSVFKGKDLPVENVSWKEAQAFLEKVNRLGGEEGAPPVRLPSEAEWEYAARAGSKWPYPSGRRAEGLAEFAWFSGNAGEKSHPVGGRKPNAFGLYDTAGNVWEWCADRFHPSYEGHPRNGSARDEAGTTRHPIRGGAYNDPAKDLRFARRLSDEEDKRVSSLGFRIAFTPPPR